MARGTRRALEDCSVGADIVLPFSGPATVIQGCDAGNVAVIANGDRIGKRMLLRGGLMVIDIGSTSPNFAHASS